ncbi:MAG: lysylphosphatidylglycerol synthase transmembrane domain-containing protein [Thermoleophilaceae bacterium]
MPASARSLRAVGLAVSLVSVAAVVWWALNQDAPRLPDERGELLALLAALGAYAIGTALRGERWRVLLRRSDIDASRADCQGLNLVGYMGNNVLPARGGDVIRVSLLVPRVRGRARGVIGTLVAERVLDAALLLALFALLGYVLLDGVGAPGGARVAIVAGAAIALVALVAGGLALAQRHEWGRRVRAFIQPMTSATRDLRGRHGARMAAVTVVIWVFEAGTWYFTGLAAGLEIVAVEALYLVALCSVFVLIPSGPGYAGTLDAAVLFGVKAIGGTGAEAVSYLLLLRFVLLVPITLAGLIVLVTRYGGWHGRRAPLESGA